MSESKEKNEKRERINAAIKIPEGGLTCSDGRTFRVRSWEALAALDKAVTIKIEVIVQMPDGGYA
jgi:hypothetical protein